MLHYFGAREALILMARHLWRKVLLGVLLVGALAVLALALSKVLP